MTFRLDSVVPASSPSGQRPAARPFRIAPAHSTHHSLRSFSLIVLSVSSRASCLSLFPSSPSPLTRYPNLFSFVVPLSPPFFLYLLLHSLAFERAFHSFKALEPHSLGFCFSTNHIFNYLRSLPPLYKHNLHTKSTRRSNSPFGCLDQLFEEPSSTNNPSTPTIAYNSRPCFQRRAYPKPHPSRWISHQIPPTSLTLRSQLPRPWLNTPPQIPKAAPIRPTLGVQTPHLVVLHERVP